MNWDCSLIMRSSIDESPLPISVDRFNYHKVNLKTTNCNNKSNYNNALNHHKHSLKLRHQQTDKSKQINKKKSLKSQNTSKKKNIEVQSNISNNVPQQFTRCISSPSYCHTYRKNIRMETEPCQNQFVRPVSSAFQIIKTQNQTNQSFIISKKKQNMTSPTSPNFIITTHSPVYVNSQQHQPAYQTKKITPFCPTQRIHSPRFHYKNAQIVYNQMQALHLVRDNNISMFHEKNKVKVMPTISFKHFIDDKSEKMQQNVQKQKQNIKYHHNEIKQVSKNLIMNEKVKTAILNKKRKIQDFLNQREQIKSVRDQSQLSEEQTSQIILSYGQILREQGKFELNMNHLQDD